MADWAALRAEFPATRNRAYLNTAAGGPLSESAAAAGAAYYRVAARDGDVHWDEWLLQVEKVREQVARLIGARQGEVAFVANASAGMNLAAGLVRTGAVTPPRVLAVRGDFPSVTYPWLQQGFAVKFLEPEPHGGVSRARLAEGLGAGARVVALGLVHYRTGYRYDLAAVAALCREHGATLAVDTTQGLGALQVDVSSGDVDFMVASGYKWLTAGYGVGVLYVNARHLQPAHYPAAGWRSAADPYALIADRLDLAPEARALELGHLPFGTIFALGAALQLDPRLGSVCVQERVLQLQGELRELLEGLGWPALPLPGGHESGIVYVPLSDASRWREHLATNGVLTSARGAGLRLSVHAYNAPSDWERLADAVRGRVPVGR